MEWAVIWGLDNVDSGAALAAVLDAGGFSEVDLATAVQIAPLVKERIKRLDQVVPLVDFMFQL